MTRHERCQKALNNARDVYETAEDGSFDDIDTLQQLIDASEVTKPKPYQDPTNYAGEYYECECGADGLKRGMNFCPECGRELDWSEEK
jgi:hypothetical protein